MILFYKEIMAVLFNREIAKASGIPEHIILYILLFLCGITVTLNINSIGGLLIFALITSAPLAAYQITYNLKTMYFLAVFFAVISCLSGLFLSIFINVPSGALIVMVSSLIFAVSLYISPKRRRKSETQTVF
jgi:manganese/iron transport system permease protein